MDPTNYTSLTQQGVLGLGVLFFGSSSIYLVVKLLSRMDEYAATLLKIVTDMITSQNAQTLSNVDLTKAVSALATENKELTNELKDLKTEIVALREIRRVR